ncbi:MAG: HDOD domain-containing protein [Campylobacterota bacterium]
MHITISNLPLLPQVVYEAVGLIQNNQPMDAVANIVSKDVELKDFLLNLANSKLYGLPAEVKSIENALSVIGLEVLYGVVLNYGAKSTLKSDISVYGTTYDYFFSMLVMQDELVNQWCSNFYKNLRNPLAKLVLVSDVGKIGFAKCLSNKKNLDHTLLKSATSHEEIHKAEKKLLGLTSEEASALMLQKWQLKHETIDILQYYDHYKVLDSQKIQLFQMLDVVKTCINIKQNYQEDAIKKASQKAKDYGLEGFKESLYAAL